MRRSLLTILALLALASPGVAQAAGGTYTIDGGTAAEQAQVRAALNASSFDWGLLPAIQVHIVAGGGDYATPGQVYLEPVLLDAGEFSWGTIQHEFGHQVDFFLLDDAKRAQLQAALGASQWCYTELTLAHDQYGCERFASEIAWAYWQSPENALKPTPSFDESAGMPPAAFRALLQQLLGAPNTVLASPVKVYAPKLKAKKKTTVK